jgi:DEAD/DEAH box helicase domain-containing protein
MISTHFPNILVFDIETMGNISSSNFVQDMQITVVGVYSYATDTYLTYFEQDLPELEPLLKQADLLVGFNNEHFDTPILNKYYFFDLWTIPSFDILKEFKKQSGKRVGLNSIAGATLGMYKSGSGKEAITLYQEGKLEELAKYCIDDVRLTKEVFDYLCSEKKIHYTSKDGWLRLTQEIPLDIDDFITEQKQHTQHSLL